MTPARAAPRPRRGPRRLTRRSCLSPTPTAADNCRRSPHLHRIAPRRRHDSRPFIAPGGVMAYRIKRIASIAAAFALAGAATAAQAVVEIQWWHAMTGAQQRPRQRVREALQREPERLQGQRGLQGQLSGSDGRRDRRVPRRQRAAHPAGVRGRHRDDDGRQGRDQAGVRGDVAGRREIRPEELHPRGRRLLHEHQGPDAVVPVQQLDDGVLLQQGRVREGGARSRTSRRSRGRPSSRRWPS